MLHTLNQKQTREKPLSFHVPMLFSVAPQGLQWVSKHPVLRKAARTPMALFTFHKPERCADRPGVNSSFWVHSTINLSETPFKIPSLWAVSIPLHILHTLQVFSFVLSHNARVDLWNFRVWLCSEQGWHLRNFRTPARISFYALFPCLSWLRDAAAARSAVKSTSFRLRSEVQRQSPGWWKQRWDVSVGELCQAYPHVAGAFAIFWLRAICTIAE